LKADYSQLVFLFQSEKCFYIMSLTETALFCCFAGQRRQRLNVLADILAGLPQETHTHFEMASFAEPACLQDIVETVVRYADSLGMNEQELPNLLGLLSSGSITAVADAYPRVASTLDQMRELYRLLQGLVDKDSRGKRLTRLHVHTLAFQAIMIINGSSMQKSVWKNSYAAAAHASLVASRHTCGDRRISVSRSRLLLDDSFSVSIERDSKRISLESDEPVSCWDEQIDNDTVVEFCLAPVLVCTDVVQTVGGGDNISTAGLVVQV
jgi:ADP-dependent glucokinase